MEAWGDTWRERVSAQGACSQAAPASGYQHREGHQAFQERKRFLGVRGVEKGRDEGKTGKEGHNRDDPKGQEATVCLEMCVLLFTFLW